MNSLNQETLLLCIILKFSTTCNLIHEGYNHMNFCECLYETPMLKENYTKSIVFFNTGSDRMCMC